MIIIKSPMISNIMLVSFNVSIYPPLIFFIYIISIYNSITNHLEDITWINFYNYDGVQLWTNKALKLSYLQFSTTVSIGATSTTTMKDDYSSTDERIPYCPPISTYCPTSRNDVYLTVNYLGGIKIINKGSALSNQSLQGMMVFKAKG